MRSTFKMIAAGLLVTIGCGLLSFYNQPIPSEIIRQRLILQADSFYKAVQYLREGVTHPDSRQVLQQRFRDARLAYKRMEWAVEYFVPLTARQINGPPVPETEPSGQVIPPEGLQVIEAYLFSQFDASAPAQLNASLTKLTGNAQASLDYFTHATLQDWQILDAAKQEVFRIETLGLNDFDDSLARQCFKESAVALNSTGNIVLNYATENRVLLNGLFRQATRYLSQPVSFNSFDRAAFITTFANSLTRQLTHLHQQLNLPNIHYNRLLNQNASTLFDENAYNRNAYINAPVDSTTAQKIALGKKLFFDKQLSGTMTRSCASCHQPDKSFTDGMVSNISINGKKRVFRNTPTLMNAALQPALFYDLRAASLEDQVADVIGSPDEMHGNIKLLSQNLWRDKTYHKLFTDAFPVKNRTMIDTSEVMNALASYIRSLTALNSRFDHYMCGDRSMLNQTEISGFNLFMGKARCSTCHYLPLFNSVLPPRYVQMEAEVIGVPKTKKGKNIDTDPGLFGIQPMEFNRHAFKVMTVRNSARTAPYMHNGVFNTLEDVVDFYDRGGGAGMGLQIPNQTLPAEHLRLSAKEKRELIEFIKTLNSQ